LSAPLAPWRPAPCFRCDELVFHALRAEDGDAVVAHHEDVGRVLLAGRRKHGLHHAPRPAPAHAHAQHAAQLAVRAQHRAGGIDEAPRGGIVGQLFAGLGGGRIVGGVDLVAAGLEPVALTSTPSCTPWVAAIPCRPGWQADPGIVGEGFCRLSSTCRTSAGSRLRAARQFAQQLDVAGGLAHHAVQRVAHLPGQLLQALLGFAPRVVDGEMVDQDQQRQHGQQHRGADADRHQRGQPGRVVGTAGHGLHWWAEMCQKEIN
jgi:hypothetical protein